MSDFENELAEIIASSSTEYAEIEIVRLSHSAWSETLNLCGTLDNDTEITDIDGSLFKVTYVPMKVTGENNEDIIANTRSLSLQGINDVVSYYEELTPTDSSERIKAEVMLCKMHVRTKVLSKVIASFPYYVMSMAASQKSNASELTIGTNPVNKSECGIKFTSTLFPSLAGYE